MRNSGVGDSKHHGSGRLRVVQNHLLHCDGGLHAHKRMSVGDLRHGLLDAAEHHPACVVAVQPAFAFLDVHGTQGPEDVGCGSAEGTKHQSGCSPY